MFFSLQNAVCFIDLTYLVPVLFIFYIQGVLKLKKNNSGAKRLIKNGGHVCFKLLAKYLTYISVIKVSALRKLYKSFFLCQISQKRKRLGKILPASLSKCLEMFHSLRIRKFSAVRFHSIVCTLRSKMGLANFHKNKLQKESSILNSSPP